MEETDVQNMELLQKRISEIGIIPVIKIKDAAGAVPLAQALARGGLPAAEITFRTACAAEAIRRITAELPNMLVGAGTVTTPELVTRTRDAGGQFIISPDTNPAVIARTRELELVSMPGAMTPSEILAAHAAGADLVKLFPAAALGSAYLKAVRSPISHVRIMAVGGINEKNAAEFLKAGAVGLGVGGNLANRQWIADGAFEKITQTAQALVAAVRTAE